MAEKKSKEVGMTVSARIPAEGVRRIDRLVNKMEKDQSLAALGNVTRSTVVKLALARGLDSLEREYK